MPHSHTSRADLNPRLCRASKCRRAALVALAGSTIAGSLVGAGAASAQIAPLIPLAGSPVAALLASDPGTAPIYTLPTTSVCDPATDAGQATRTLADGTLQTTCFDAAGDVTDVVPTPDGFKTLDLSGDAGSVDFGDPGSGPCTRTDYCGQGDLPDPTDQNASTGAASPLSLASAQAAAIPPKSSSFWGLSDNNLIIPNPLGGSDAPFDIFTSPYFPPLGVANVRLIVPWDVQLHVGSYEQLNADAWIAAAILAGKHPLISFEKCHDPATDHETRACNRRSALPPVPAYAAAVRLFVLAHPLVKDYTAWNEPNNGGQPTIKAPATAANFYVKLAQICASSCRVAAGDFLDGPAKRLTRYVVAYVKTLGHMHVGRFSWHPYSDAEDTVRHPTQPHFARLATYTHFVHKYDPTANIWVTEVGAYHDFPRAGIHNTDAVQGTVTQAIVTGIPPVDKKVDRLFYYNLKGSPTFDTGLLALDGTPRSNASGTLAYDRYKNR